MTIGGSYEYNGYTIVVDGAGNNSYSVYGPNGFENSFSTEPEAEQYIDELVNEQ